MIRHDDALDAVVQALLRAFTGEDALGQHGDLAHRFQRIEEFPRVPESSRADSIGVGRVLGCATGDRPRTSARVAHVQVALVEGRLLVDGDHDGLGPGLLGHAEHLFVRTHLLGRVALEPEWALCRLGDFRKPEARDIADDHGRPDGGRGAVHAELTLRVAVALSGGRGQHDRARHAAPV